MLSKSEILARRPTHDQFVEVPAWGGKVYVRQLSAAERDAYDASRQEAAEEDQALNNFRARLVVLTAVDETGARVFSDDDAIELGNTPSPEIVQIFDKAIEVNAMTKEEKEEIEKNS